MKKIQGYPLSGLILPLGQKHESVFILAMEYFPRNSNKKYITE